MQVKQQIFSHQRVLWALMLTICLDTMGFLLVFPLFPVLLNRHNAFLVAGNVSVFLQGFYYALALAMWPLGNFFGTAFLGEMSDKVGRKKVLLVGLFMVSLTYALQGASIYLHSIFLFVAVRFLQGFFGGNYDIAQAAIADISPSDKKARNMGFVALASSLGIVLGPILAALTTSTQINMRSVGTPFWIAASLALINFIWIAKVYHETYVPKTHQGIDLMRVFASFKFIFIDKRVQRLGVVYFLLMAGWGLYVQEIPLVMQQLYLFSPRTMGYFFLVVGLGFVGATQFLQPILVKRYPSKRIYVVSMILVAPLILAAGVEPLLSVEWLTAFFMALFFVTGYGCLLAMVSDAVTKDEQGQVMGGIGAVGSLAFAFTGLSLAVFSFWSVLLPIILSALVYFLSGFLMVKYKAQENIVDLLAMPKAADIEFEVKE